MIRTAVVAMLVLAVTACAGAGLVYSWEGTNDGWNFSDVTVVSNTATTGVTEGSYSVELLIPSQIAWGLEQLYNGDGPDGYPAGFLADGLTVSFDVTTSSDNLWVAQYIVGGKPFYHPSTGYAGCQSPYTDCSSTGGLKTTTVTWDFPVPPFPEVDHTAWAEHRIQIRGDNSNDILPARTVWLDNYRVTPEPATMVLLGIGGIGMLLRRRRS